MIHTPDRWLSKAGVASRKDVLEWIGAGRLSLSGRLVDPDRAIAAPDCAPGTAILPPFCLDGILLKPPPPLFLLLNKPRGVLVSLRDPQGRPVVGDLLARSSWGQAAFGAVRPLGRLDQASAGLLLLTNYPEIFSDFLEPSAGTLRTYRVQIAPPIRKKDRDLFYSGTAGGPAGYGVIEVTSERRSSKKEWIVVRLAEGRNREIRNFLGWYGYRVLHLIRTSFGPFSLGDLPPGDFLDITDRVGEAGTRWTKWVPTK